MDSNSMKMNNPLHTRNMDISLFNTDGGAFNKKF